MALPPLHRIDSTPIYIFEDDDAWEHDRIGEEIGAEVNLDHPLVRYYAGLTRYDLDTVRDYFDRDKRPAMFVLKRLGVREYARALDMAANIGDREAQLFAAEHGLVRVDNVPALASVELGNRPRLRRQDMDAVIDAIGRDRWLTLGQAVLLASRELTAAEGKPSA
jgi:hypothetical protein